jgi:hypothetical protein
VTRAVWSPALVGWVGGNNWNAHFGSGNNRRAAPATGWYPLAPKDAYVPTYRMAHDNLRYLNRNAGSAQPDIRGRARDVRIDANRRDEHRRAGLTVVPHDQFRQRGTVVVPTAPRGTVSPAQLFPIMGSTPAVPPAPQMTERQRSRDWRQVERGAPAPATRNPAEPAPAMLSVQPQPGRQAASDPGRRVGSFTNDGRRQRMEPITTSMPARIAPVETPAMPKPAVMLSLPSEPAAQPQPGREERGNRYRRGDVDSERRDADPERERRPRGAESFQQQAQMQQQQQLQQQQQQQQQMLQQQQQAQQQQQRALQVQQVQQQQVFQMQQQAQQQQQRAQQAQQMQQQQVQQQQQRQQEQQQRAVQVQEAAPAPQPAAIAQPQPRPQRENAGMRRAREDAERMR